MKWGCIMKFRTRTCIIVFYGASSTGKTTIINKIFPKFNAVITSNENIGSATPAASRVESISRKIALSGGVINENVDTATQLEITFGNVAQIITNPAKFILTERFLVDNLAYSKLGNVSSHVLDIHENFIDYFFNSPSIFKIIPFYIPIEFGIAVDNVRSEDVEYQANIDLSIKLILEQFSIRYHILSGDVQERINSVCNVLRGYGIFI